MAEGAGAFPGEAPIAIPDRLGETGAGIEQHFQPAEEVAGEGPIRLKVRQQRLVALGDVEERRRRDFAQVPHRRQDAGRHGLSLVDVERAAMRQGHAEIVVGAEGVVPGQPVDKDRWRLGQKGEALLEHDLVGHEHALGVDHCLRLAGGARGQQELCDGVRAYRGEGGVDARVVLRPLEG